MKEIDNIEHLKKYLQKLHCDIEDELATKFERSLPFQDGLFDRWERAKRLKFGEGSNIYNSALVYGKVKVGKETWIGPYTILDGSGGLTIGSHCSISAGVHIYTHDTVMKTLSGGKKDTYRKPVIIGDCTYIGAQAIIKAGVEIGSQCVIGANAFVNKNVPNKRVVVGNPARIIGEVVCDGEEIKIVYYHNEVIE